MPSQTERLTTPKLVARFAIGFFAAFQAAIWTIYGVFAISQDPVPDVRTFLALSLASLTTSVFFGGMFAWIERTP